MATMLPEELVREILMRLPVKSLLRFRCVSKSWNLLITSSCFINAHINCNDAKNNYNALLRCYYLLTRDDSYAIHSDNESLDKIMELDFPQETREFFNIVACVRGVVCLMDSYQRYNTVLLWNPSIRKFLALPNPARELSTQELMKTVLGFGFDTLNNDYKFVRIYNLEGTPKMDIFRLSTGCWTDVEISRSSFPSIRDTYATELNGILHWLSYDQHLIMGFDLSKETFSELGFPTELHAHDWLSNVFIEAWRGSLTAIESQGGELFSFWVMKEYGVTESWTKVYEIREPSEFIGITRNKGLMLYRNDSEYIDAYDPETRHTTHDILHLKGPLISLQITPYIESLVLLKEGENQPTLEPFRT